jgi:hypothetical protein
VRDDGCVPADSPESATLREAREQSGLRRGEVEKFDRVAHWIG